MRLPEITNFVETSPGYVEGELSNGAEFAAAWYENRWHFSWAKDGDPIDTHEYATCPRCDRAANVKHIHTEEFQT